MFCAKCGKELADDSQFCAKCGHALTSGVAASKQWYYARPGILALAAVFLVLLIWGASIRRVSLIPKLPAKPHAHIIPIVDGALTVRARGFSARRFVVPSGATNVSVDGHFIATGGMGNDVEVFVLSEDSFVNFQNHHSAQAYYNSGKVTESNINAVLPGTGIYYLVFNNSFSSVTPKAVQANATLNYLY
jgi:predicted nucleic acid-binding Zn ribbon protein